MEDNNLNKKVRKAVRTFLIEDDKVVVIKYNSKENEGYYDIPGGKIEENETSSDAAIREFKEETGIEIVNPELIGKAIIEYPNKIFDLDLYKVMKSNGISESFEENDSMWIEIDKVLKEENIFPTIKILEYIKENKKINIKITCNEKHKIENIEEKTANKRA